MSLSVELVKEASAFFRLGEEWDELLARSSADQPTLSSAWLSAWWQIFGAGRRLRVVLLRDGRRLVGAAPWCGRFHFYPPGVPFRRVEPLASGELEEDEICSEYLSPIAERGAEAEVAESLVAVLLRGRLGTFDELVLPAMDADAPMVAELADRFAASGEAIERHPQETSAHIPLPSSFEAYLQALPSNRRQNVRRALRKWNDWADGQASFVRVESRNELREGQRILEALHGERWSQSRQGGAFGSLRFRAFHELVLPQLLERGALDLFWVVAHHRPVAARYNIVWGKKVHAYLGGRAMDLPTGVSPGIAVHAHAIERAIQAGLEEYDFLGGMRGHKRELGLRTRELVVLRLVRSAKLEAVRRLSSEALRRTQRRFAPLLTAARARLRVSERTFENGPRI